MSDSLLLPGERLDDLQRNGLKLIQHPKSYRFGMDSVLLAHFANLGPADRVCDLGTGTGVLPVLLSDSFPGATFFALEIQPALADMARRSVAHNGLSERITVLEADLLNAPALLGANTFNAVICNPPYKKRQSGLGSDSDVLRIARHEQLCMLTDIVCISAALLKNRGKLFIMQRAERVTELVGLLLRNNLAPKRFRFVHPKPGSAANLVLIHAVLGAKPSFTTVLPPLVVYDENGNETAELKGIYGR